MRQSLSDCIFHFIFEEYYAILNMIAEARHKVSKIVTDTGYGDRQGFLRGFVWKK